MEIILSKKTLVLTIAVWFLIINAMSAVSSLFISIGSPVPIGRIIIGVFITTHLLMWPPTIANYIVGYRMRDRELPAVILRALPAAIAAMTVGSWLSFLVHLYIFPVLTKFTIWDGALKVWLPSLILTVLFTCTGQSIDRFWREKAELKKDITRMSSAIEKLDAKCIKLKLQGTLYRIAYEDIIYLTSHGKKTTIHTEKMDYEIPQVIKEMDETLPPELFVRIHKQYIANIRYISRIRHYEGGRYWAYLNDEDENTLPIGRKYAPTLKQRLDH